MYTLDAKEGMQLSDPLSFNLIYNFIVYIEGAC